MTIQELIVFAENRLQHLHNAVATATQLGDLDKLSSLQIEVTDTEETLSKLRNL